MVKIARDGAEKAASIIILYGFVRFATAFSVRNVNFCFFVILLVDKNSLPLGIRARNG